MLLLYVDDIVVTGNCSHAINTLIVKLQTEFDLKDLGLLHYFLGVEVAYMPHGLFLSQQNYIQEVIHCAGMDDYKPSLTLDAAKPNSAPLDSKEFLDPTLYKSLVGSLQYITQD